MPVVLGLGFWLTMEALLTRMAGAATQFLQDPPPRWQLVPTAFDPLPSPPPRTVPLSAGPKTRIVAGSDLVEHQPIAPSHPQPDLPADAQAVSAAPIDQPFLLAPSLSGGVPTGYVGGWGDYFISASAGTPGRLRGGVPDGSINLGFGLGDPLHSVGFEVSWGIGSIQNFNSNGSVGFSTGRILVNRPDLQVSVAAGLLDAIAYGSEPGQPSMNGYGALSAVIPLRPNDSYFRQRLQFTVGGGGSSFGAVDSNFQTNDKGFFVAAGLELSPSIGLSLGQSSRSTNVNLSYIPFSSLPIFVNMVAADLFNTTPFGTVGVLSIGWGDNLQRGFWSQ